MKTRTNLTATHMVIISLLSFALISCGSDNTSASCELTPEQLPVLSIETDQIEVKENEGNVSVAVTLSQASCKDTSIHFVNSDGSELSEDFSLRTDAVIPAGETQANLKLNITNDTLKEDRETFLLTVKPSNDFIIDDSEKFQVDIIPVVGALFDGYYGMCSLSEDNLVKCWGYNGGYNFAVNHDDDIGDTFGQASGVSYACNNESQSVMLNPKTYVKDDGSVCTSQGGVGYVSGFDLNANNVLEDDEITGGENFCEGGRRTNLVLQFEPEKQGRFCEFGGTAVYYGSANSDGSVLVVTEMGQELVVSDLGDEKIIDMGLGEYHSCALFADKTVKCWGSNSSGKLGLGLPNEDESRYIGDDPAELGNALVAVDFGTGNWVKQLSVGDNHSCVVLENGNVKCWGDNHDGELGYGDMLDRGDSAESIGDKLLAVDLGTDKLGKTYTATQVAAGYSSTCALLHDGNVKCWGRGRDGILGNDDVLDIGDENGEMGNNLPVINLGSNRTATRVFTGYRESCAILDNGALKCWGNNDYGQLGQESRDRAIGNGGKGDLRTACHTETDQMLVNIVDIADGEGGCNNGGGILIQQGLDTDKDSILQEDEYTYTRTSCDEVGFEAIGQQFSIEPGGAICNTYGGVGYYYGIDANGLFDDEMGDALPEINLGNSSGIKDVQLNWYNNCVIFNDNTVKCIGYGDTTGLDTQDDWGDDVGETFASAASPDLGTGVTATAIAGRGYQMCALTEAGDVKCWGYSDYGELGQPFYYGEYLGDGEDNDGEPKLEMGDNLPFVEIY